MRLTGYAGKSEHAVVDAAPDSSWFCRSTKPFAMSIHWQRIWEHVTREFQCDQNSIHGPSHWTRVERNGLFIARRSGAVEDVVRLFAVFHDSRRDHDGWDDTHGSRGAAYAANLRGVLFDINDEHFELLHYACTWHTHGQLSNQPTIGTCWDSDRLDLGRVGMQPAPEYMSTECGREIARHGSIDGLVERSGRSVIDSSPSTLV